ncbi:MAG: EAL domain-containing protein, partial [Ruminiclostridium sp.]|nr:EAL domain-containing protein [Ruminiclostridium sp.]
KAEFLRFFKHNIKNGVLYRFSNGKLVLTLKKPKKGNFERMVGKMLEDFYASHEQIGLDYKLIVAETVPEITSPVSYIRLIDFIEGEMGINETHRVTDSDIKRFLSYIYIVSELEDIAIKRDIEDERVLVYCQPVFNLAAGTYDTAEALMRLKLPERGLVFPDKFIPIAEKNGLIHQLSLTILNKTCENIRKLMDEGYNINRISVNFSTLDLKHELFCEELQDIIIRNDIPYDKIAIEITESRGEMDFEELKAKISELQSLGIKFYLDDFGTGYSNFERIMELPFDIIKFDRSMLIESVKSDSSKYMVSTFASMFNDLHYSVLFEGVEDERDEAHCRGMFAKYLQGYKYSKPIPIDELRAFLQKSA